MTIALPPRIINVLHVSEATGVHPETHALFGGLTWHEREEASYYAVRQPEDAWDRWNEGDEPRMELIGTEPRMELIGTEPYALFGGLPVYIHSQNDIDGLRALLDAIEADLKGNAA